MIWLSIFRPMESWLRLINYYYIKKSIPIQTTVHYCTAVVRVPSYLYMISSNLSLSASNSNDWIIKDGGVCMTSHLCQPKVFDRIITNTGHIMCTCVDRTLFLCGHILQAWQVWCCLVPNVCCLLLFIYYKIDEFRISYHLWRLSGTRAIV